MIFLIIWVKEVNSIIYCLFSRFYGKMMVISIITKAVENLWWKMSIVARQTGVSTYVHAEDGNMIVVQFKKYHGESL
jgi:hypothetical protein